MNLYNLPLYQKDSQDANSCELVPSGTTPLPGLKKVLEDGEIFVKGALVKGDHVHALPYNFQKIEVDCPSWTHEYKWRGSTRKCAALGFVYKGRYYGDGRTLTGFSSLPTGSIGAKDREFVDSISILKAQADLRKALVNTPLLLAEAAATLKTLKLYSRAILNNVITLQRKDLKEWLAAVKRLKGKPDRLKKIAQDIASRHLEFVFGVLPLIDEMEGMVELVTREQHATRTGRGRHTMRKNLQDRVTSTRGARVTETTEVRYSVRTGLRCDIDLKVLHDMSQIGFNPLYTFYDLTPLSFVTGWFSNFDLWVKSLDPIPGLNYVTGYSTRRSELTSVKTAGPGSDNTYDSFGSGKGRCVVTSQNRVPHDAMPEIQSLRFMDRTSFFAAAASLSLVIQRSVKIANNEIKRKPFRYRKGKPKYLPPITYKKA